MNPSTDLDQADYAHVRSHATSRMLWTNGRIAWPKVIAYDILLIVATIAVMGHSVSPFVIGLYLIFVMVIAVALGAALTSGK